MNSEQKTNLERRARQEPPSVLHAWTKDSRRTLRNVAEEELRRREREMRETHSLTGVVSPLDAA